MVSKVSQFDIYRRYYIKFLDTLYDIKISAHFVDIAKEVALEILITLIFGECYHIHCKIIMCIQLTIDSYVISVIIISFLF